MQIPTFIEPADPYASNDPVAKCDPVARPGVVAFRDWVLSQLGGTDLGIVRACTGPRPTSKHHEGRAWDWAPPSQAAANELLDCLLKDRGEDPRALVRRAGIRVIIWQRRIWTPPGWAPYTKSGGDPHTGHIHFGFDWDGANAKTSLYTLDPSGDAAVFGMATGAQSGPIDAADLGAMYGTEVPARRTPLTDQALAEALAAAYIQVTGEAPDYNTLGLAWAMVQHETGHTMSMWNHNVGNIKKTSSWTGDYHKLPVNEPNPYFRSYPSAAAGSADYWRLMRRRYSRALVAFKAGDPLDAAKQLRAKGYFTAPVDLYAKALGRWFARYKDTFVRESWASRLTPLLAGVAITIAAAAAEEYF